MYSPQKHDCTICKGKLNQLFAFSGLDSKTPVYDYRPYSSSHEDNSNSRIAQGSGTQQQTPTQKIHNLHKLFRFSGIQAGQWITKVHVEQ